MLRPVFFAVAAAALVAAASAALLQIALPASDRVIMSEDIIGTYSSIFALDCPVRIQHTSTADVGGSIPNEDIIMGNNRCNPGGTLDIIDVGEASSRFEGQQRELINAVTPLVNNENAIYAISPVNRTCGGRKLTFPPNTLVIFVKPDETIRVLDVFRFDPNQRYMIVDKGEGFSRCFYEAPPLPSPSPPAPSPVPSPSAAASPEASPSAAVSPSTVADPSVTPSGAAAGSPDPSGASSPDPSTGPASPSPSTGPASPSPSAGSAGPSPSAGSAGPSPSTGAGEASPSPSDDDDDDDDPSVSDDDDDDDDDAAPTPSPEDDPVCFPADATVRLADGSTKTMADLAVGDRVQVGPETFSDVFMFSHKLAHRVHSFVSLTTRQGHKLSATAGHYIYLNGRMTPAGQTKTGDSVMLWDGSLDSVTGVDMEKKTGLYNPQTVHGDIVVNGVRASTFTQAVRADTAHALLAPLRMLYVALGHGVSFLDGGADQVAGWLPKGGVSSL